ncbi:MAG: spore germination protein, partial [Syntrophomonadaceae bacterium]|nr:spore germination protein [Syntrophomonadaceae bacterium]
MSRGSNQIKAGEKASPGTLSGKLEHNLKIIRSILGESNDIIIREMKISSNAKVDAAVIYIDGLVDRD